MLHQEDTHPPTHRFTCMRLQEKPELPADTQQASLAVPKLERTMTDGTHQGTAANRWGNNKLDSAFRLPCHQHANNVAAGVLPRGQIGSDLDTRKMWRHEGTSAACAARQQRHVPGS